MKEISVDFNPLVSRLHQFIRCMLTFFVKQPHQDSFGPGSFNGRNEIVVAGYYSCVANLILEA